MAIKRQLMGLSRKLVGDKGSLTRAQYAKRTKRTYEALRKGQVQVIEEGEPPPDVPDGDSGDIIIGDDYIYTRDGEEWKKTRRQG